MRCRFACAAAAHRGSREAASDPALFFDIFRHACRPLSAFHVGRGQGGGAGTAVVSDYRTSRLAASSNPHLLGDRSVVHRTPCPVRLAAAMRPPLRPAAQSRRRRNRFSRAQRPRPNGPTVRSRWRDVVELRPWCIATASIPFPAGRSKIEWGIPDHPGRHRVREEGRQVFVRYSMPPALGTAASLPHRQPVFLRGATARCHPSPPAARAGHCRVGRQHRACGAARALDRTACRATRITPNQRDQQSARVRVPVKGSSTEPTPASQLPRAARTSSAASLGVAIPAPLPVRVSVIAERVLPHLRRLAQRASASSARRVR